MTATSRWFSSSEHEATEVAEPLTSSATMAALVDSAPSATRTTLTSQPLADKPSAKPALNVASPHGVGGKLVSMPMLGGERRSGTKRPVNDGKRVGAFKVVPTGGCHRSVRRERLLVENSGGQLTQSRTGWGPNAPY